MRVWNGKGELVHRLVCVETHGPLAAGEHAHHECEERLCVNADHIAPMSVLRHNRSHVDNTAGAIGDVADRLMADGEVWSARRLRREMTWASHDAIGQMLHRAVERGEVERIGLAQYRLRGAA